MYIFPNAVKNSQVCFLDTIQAPRPKVPEDYRKSLIPSDYEIRSAARNIGLSKGALLAAFEIAGHERRKGRTPITGQMIAWLCGCSLRTAFNYLAELELAGLLIVSPDEYRKDRAGPARQNAKIRLIRLPDERVRAQRIQIAIARKESRHEARMRREMARKIEREIAKAASAQIPLPSFSGDIYAIPRIGNENSNIDHSFMMAKYGLSAAEFEEWRARAPDK